MLYLCSASSAARQLSRVAALQSTGVEFPEVTSFWTGTERYRSLGAGVRAKSFAFVPVKVRKAVENGIMTTLPIVLQSVLQLILPGY